MPRRLFDSIPKIGRHIWALISTITNDSPEVVREMEVATGVSASTLMSLRPGLDNIREKLRLASTRRTTRVEDAAYSLLGIFSVALPVTYGEGDKALGRLLSQLLTSSGDTSILAWTGTFGSFNSCLPTNNTVFNESPATHIPPAITRNEVGTIIGGLRAPSLDLDLATRLYEKLRAFPIPFFVGQRMKLPCLTFKIRLTSTSQNGSEFVFRTALGAMEIKTRQILSQLDSLYLVHPWIDFLLDRRPLGNTVGTTPEDEYSGSDEFPSFSGHSSPQYADDAESLSVAALQMNLEQKAALQLVARLTRPFGALLLTPTRRNVEEYRR